MKTYTLHSHPVSILSQFPAFGKKLAAASGGSERVIALGGDLEKSGLFVCAAIGLQTPLALRLLTREESVALVRELCARGFAVHFGLEACGFGWKLPRELREAGANVLIFAPEPLNGKRSRVPLAWGRDRQP